MMDNEVIGALHTEESAHDVVKRTVVPLQEVHVDTHTVGVHVHEVVTACTSNAFDLVTIVACERHINIQILETHRVDIDRNRCVLSSLWLTSDHEVVRVHIRSFSCQTTEIKRSLAFACCNISGVSLQRQTFIDGDVA